MDISLHSMSISDLSAASGMPITTIKFYIRKSLLPKPLKTGKTKAVYSLTHINRLRLIKKLKNDEKMPLRKISEIVKLIDDRDENIPENKTTLSNHRPLIVEAAIEVIKKKGYENTTIADIVNAAHIGKGTFYKYFKNKKNLFIACVKEIILKEAGFVDVYEGDYDVKDENDVFDFLNKQLEDLFWISPLSRDMIKMLQAAAINNPLEFSDTLTEVIQLKIDTFKKQIAAGIRKGFLRKFKEDELTILAVMTIGIHEHCYEYFRTSGMDKNQGKMMLKVITNIILNGIINHKS